MQHQKLLAIYAHPDDEAFGLGGTLAHYAAHGTEVVLVCATRGEVGEISDPALATPETLGAVREGELRCAATTLGLSDLIFLDYRDSGMEGTPENNDPRAFVNIPAEEVIPRLVGIIRRFQPQVILTFEPQGGYGHPDHIAIHKHTVAAFQAAGDSSQYPDQGAAWQPSRLFYNVFTRSEFKELARRMASTGVDTSEIERWEEAELGWPDDQVHVTMDVSAVVETKWNAFLCHATQFGPNSPFRNIPEADRIFALGREHFVLAVPEPTPGQQLPDLFSGLTSAA